MQLSMHNLTTSRSFVLSSHSYSATTTHRASKRASWYPAFSEMAAWSSIG
ncbi:unannotated protein [freshwater metagenome]|uniref:Unannotated protein n=1 Tax=freshwater metagenome TaxID=449393 RepID=A0A6J6LPT7_9ZZZZ